MEARWQVGPGDTSTPPSGRPHSQASRDLASGGREGVVCGQPRSPNLPALEREPPGVPLGPLLLAHHEETAG